MLKALSTGIHILKYLTILIPCPSDIPLLRGISALPGPAEILV